MFWIIRFVVVAVLIALLVLGLGYLLPATRTAQKTTLIDAAPERVYEIVNDLPKQAEWRSDVRSLKVDGDGELRSWTEEQESGLVVRLREVAKKPNTQYEVAFETSNGIRGSIVGTFEPSSENRTKFTVYETVTVENPMRRVVCWIVLNYDTLMDSYFGDLNRYASKPLPQREPL